MKAGLFLLLALRAAFASACHQPYKSCQCLDRDGTLNITATTTVCTADDGTGANNLCYGGDFMGNCDWDDFCTLAGSGYSNCFRRS